MFNGFITRTTAILRQTMYSCFPCTRFLALACDYKASSDAPVVDIQSLLFRSKNSEEPRPFDNIPDLGRAIATLPGGQHADKEGVVTSFLRQVFNGTRPCPSEYLKAIVAATRMRIDERGLPDNPEKLIADIEKAVQALKKRREHRVREKHRPKLAKAIGSTEVRFAVNPPLGELPVASSVYKRISLLIAENLALGEEQGQPRMTYKICYPVETDAVDLWRLIFDELIGKFGDSPDIESIDPEIAAERIQLADTSNRLQIYLIPYYLCLASALIDDPDNRDKCTGVTLQLEKGGMVRLFEIHERNIMYWRQMYYDLENGVFGEYRRLEFSRYRNLVMRLSPAS
jgi:hypothetical protein